MSEKYRPYIGKDGNKYSDVWERDASNRRYEQRQKLIEEQQRTNKLMREQEERIRNGGYTNSEILIQQGTSTILGYIESKGYKSEVSKGISTFIIIMYVFGIIACVAVGFAGYVNCSIWGIGLIIAVHIYLKISVYIMEKSIKNNTKLSKNVNIKGVSKEKSRIEKQEDKIAINLSKDVKLENKEITSVLESEDGNHYIFVDGKEIQHVFVTGLKKAECIDTLITSVIYKAKPDEVKLLIIDRQTIYNVIPHLLIPVVTEPKKAVGALAWVAQEMQNRYDLLSKKGIRSFDRYNELQEQSSKKLPEIIVIINEITDLLEVDKEDTEDLILRVISRAKQVGIYMIIGTKDYSSKMISNNIKEAISSKIIFESSDENMLFYREKNQEPIKLSRAKISSEEIEKILENIKNE